MGRLRTNQSGFNAVAAVLILVIVGILGLGGWYMWRTKKPVVAINTPVASPAAVQPTPTKKADIYDGWNTVVDPDGAWTSVKIPKDWLSQVCDGGTYISVGPDKSSLGACNSDAIAVLSFTYSTNAADAAAPVKFDDDMSITDESVVANGVTGHKYTNVKKTGTDVTYSGYTFISYVFQTKGKVYKSSYVYKGTGTDYMATADTIVKSWLF